ncbi:MAG: DUF86 domain-containing protein [Thermoanaerobaculales bacterium]|jgi:uncharacterized protein with HEPN domain|nr:DUF86 domain-containing protein [Thermoanaerobaculales bacterium]
MTLHDDTVALRHMRDHVAEAIELTADRSRDDLDADRVFALALTKLVEIVGEAAARVSEELRDSHKEIPWRQIVGTRNRLIHGYDAVDHDILWGIVDRELPVLLGQLDSALASVDPSHD